MEAAPSSASAPGGIQRLPEEVANQIAAGEVIERPASVVKELVENALDAGATRLEVEIREGGIEYIRVSDNGCGIPAREMELAFQRHATSKIRRVQDLLRVRTLGFRGEALPSIAAVSELEMRSRPRGQDEGTLLHLEGGRVLGQRAVGCPVGTTVIVRRLFFNTPARYKFLKGPLAERRHVLEWMMRISLAQPGCSFSLKADGKECLKTPGDGKLNETIAAVFGRRLAEAMLPLEAHWAGGRVTGCIARPAVHRGDRDQEIVIVNGRPIHSPMIMRAIEKGYETLLPSRRFPVAVLHLEMDPADIDVNVHPAKLEIKFADENQVFRQVMMAVREALTRANLYHMPRAEEPPEAGPGRPFDMDGPSETGKTAAVSPADPAPQTPAGHWPWDSSRRQASLFAQHGTAAKSTFVPLTRERQPVWPSQIPQGPHDAAAPLRHDGPGSEAAEARQRLRELQLLGYLDDLFLIGVSRGQLWVIDQHIVHERILYERFLRAYQTSTPPPRQRLLHPVLIELPASDSAVLEDHLDILDKSGFTIEPFGPQSYRVLAVPAELATLGATAIAKAVTESLQEISARPGTGSRYHRWAASLACRLAVKAGEVLPLEAASYLLQQLAETENPFTCPHGRPIVVIFSRQELERRFGRH